jgi:hypothetical protein
MSGSTSNAVNHKIILYNNTAAAALVSGVNSRCIQTATGILQIDTIALQGRFTLASPSDVILRHWVALNVDVSLAASAGVAEVYADVFIRKVL